MTLDGSQHTNGVWMEKVRAIRELGAVGVILVLVLGGAWVTYAKFGPLIEAIPTIAQSLSQHREYERDIYSLLLRQCQDNRTYYKLDPGMCGRDPVTR